jgi:hypothetical protein
MSPRQARRERREAERKARKAELKRAKAAAASAVNAPALPDVLGPELQQEFSPEFIAHAKSVSERIECRTADERSSRVGFVLQNTPTPTPSRAEINRQNAQHSTGPRTSDGKLASSRNSLKHGLAGGTLLIPGEDPAAFEALRDSLLEEHQPATETEVLLVQEMAQSWWLTQRAIRLQNECFTPEGVDQRQLSLLLRYQTTHDRAFFKALNTLLRLKQSRAREQAVVQLGFVSQPAHEPTSLTRSPEQSDRLRLHEAALLSQPKTPMDEAALLSEPKIQPNGFVSQNPSLDQLHQSEPPRVQAA